MKVPLFEAQKEWVEPEEFPDLRSYDEIAVDLETRDPDLKKKGSGSVIGNGEVVGIAVAVPGRSFYFPIAHGSGPNMDRKKVLSWFADTMATPSLKIFHNAMYDVCWIRKLGIKINGLIVDTMIAASLVDENRFRYSLNELSWDFIGRGKSEVALNEAAKSRGLDPKEDLWQLPAMEVGAYAEKDAELTLELWQMFKKEIVHQDIESVFNLETDLFPCLVDMRFKGVRVDIERAHKLKQQLTAQENELLLKVKQETGIEPQIWAARSIATVFDKLGLEYDRTEKSSAPSFTKNFLQEHSNPIVQMIAKAREINKAHTTFIDTIIRYEHKGRIHAEINQIRSDQGGTVTGRFSYNNPNLQQLPARNKDLGPLIRSLFLPEEKHTWGCFDYSQQEPRLVVHFASLIGEGSQGTQELIKAYEEEDADFHQTVAEMANIPRAQAKTINLGLFYGMGINKLSRELGISYEDAQTILQEYNKRVPFVKKLSETTMQVADKKGFLRTLKGRRCRFNLWEPNTFGLNKALTEEDAILQFGRKGIKRAMTYKSLNRLIQGSAADQTKQAMVDCSNLGFRPLLQIHDELCFNISNDADIKTIKHTMENCCKLEVPSKVDVEIGDSWGNAK